VLNPNQHHNYNLLFQKYLRYMFLVHNFDILLFFVFVVFCFLNLLKIKSMVMNVKLGKEERKKRYEDN